MKHLEIAVNTRTSSKRSFALYAALIALFSALGSSSAAHAQAVECFVYDDGYTNMAGPSDAVYFNGPQKACIPDGTGTGTCRRWFGRCRTVGTHSPVSFRVFDDGYTNASVWSDSIYIPQTNRACIPDGTASGTCARWFGTYPSGVYCSLFNDGYTSMTQATDAIYFRKNGEVCRPDSTSTGTCRKWFGRCFVAPPLL